ncbi:hypothetical protein ACH5RR_010319 [Cinchona calisaya]|uniref:Protein phosphatase n=1 Tax=Cinchona calisaya TaxID=153742 RepID=A0ABD3AIL5_9GENT
MATLNSSPSFETWGLPSSYFYQGRNDIPVNIDRSLLSFWVPTVASDFRPQQSSPTIQESEFKQLWVPKTVSKFLPSSISWAVGREQKQVLDQKQPPSILEMVCGSLCFPKEGKEYSQGDDAHFISLDTQTIGVADGVGGWSRRGIDAGKYARDLMKNSEIAAEFEPKGAVNPKKVMQEAYSNTKADGSSTACIITLHSSNNILHAANVGDSGFVLIRGGKVVYKSPVQQHRFNFPYQLGNCTDDINLAQELQVPVEEGDVVIAGTDGFFDNVHGSEIEEIMKSKTSEGAQPKEVACTLANIALYNSFDRFADSPFAIESRKAGYSHRGGKEDDITVIVAFIQASN